MSSYSLEGDNNMEPLIYIEEKDKQEAAKLAGGFTIEDTLKRAYINALASELAMKYMAQEEINTSNIYNLHNIHKIREQFDIADVMLPNIHIDVRMVYDENCIFIPKSHFEYEITPDIYLVFKMLEDESCVKFLGFFEPKLINKNNHNEKYYFIEKEKLSHPTDLKSYIENFNGNTTEALPDEDFENGQKLAMSLIDHDIADDDKRRLLKMLVKCAALREDLIEFDNFEWISYHVATTEELTELSDTVIQDDVEPIKDEFEIFEQTDEFTDDLTEEENNGEDNLGEDLLDDFSDGIDDISIDEPVETETSDDITSSNIELPSSDEDTILPEEDTTPHFDEENSMPQDSEINEDSFNLDESFDLNLDEGADSDNEDTNNEDINDITNDENILETESLDLSDLPDLTDAENNETDTADIDIMADLPELSADETLPEEKIHLSEFNELPFDTSDNIQEPDEEVLDLDELDSLSDKNQDSEQIIEEPALNEVTDFENLGERDDIKPVEENTFEDDEITSLEDIEPISTDEPIQEQTYQPDLTSLDNLEISEDISADETVEDFSEAVSLDELNKTDEFTESDISEEIPEQPVSMEELSTAVPDTPINNDKNDEDFPETLTTQADTDDALTSDTTSYENSTVISNQFETPGEFAIDINQPVNLTEDTSEDIEKLEVLYNQNNNDDNNLQFKTSMPEKGKKAIAIATIVIAALASLLIYASMNKSSNQVAEQNNPSVLEKNLPKLDEQELPDDGTILPEKTNPTVEETAKTAVQNVNKPKAPVIEEPYLDVKKLSWSVPDYVSYNDEFRKYLQTAGKSLKLSLSSDLLLATEYAYSDQIQVNVILSNDGGIQNANILQSSGSAQIDDIVLRTVNDTLKVLKAPAGVIVGDSIQLTLKIYL